MLVNFILSQSVKKEAFVGFQRAQDLLFEAEMLQGKEPDERKKVLSHI